MIDELTVDIQKEAFASPALAGGAFMLSVNLSALQLGGRTSCSRRGPLRRMMDGPSTP